MRKWKTALLFCLGIVYGICAVDGISVVRGLSFLGTTAGNWMSALFFLLMAGILALTWRTGSLKAARRLRSWSFAVLAGSLVMLLVIWLLLLAGSGRGAQLAAMYLLVLLSVPATSCSAMVWPIFGWSVVLVASWMLTRRIKRNK